MFGLRPDGKRLKNIDPIQKIMPHIMPARHDGQNIAKYEVRCEPFDKFIKEEREKGNRFNYMHLVVAGIVRTFALKPRLNRFIMNGRIYKRKGGIFVSFVVKKRLSADAADSTVKVQFTGHENIYEIKEKIDAGINTVNAKTKSNGTDKLARVLTFVPNFIIKFVVGLIKFFDKHGMLPNSILKLSPFHTSCFVTNLKSIKGEYIYHHIYDFGTTGLFFAMGKEKVVPVVDEKDYEPYLTMGKVMNIGIVMDERFCDGFYYVSALKMLKDYFNNPSKLIERLDKVEEDETFDFKNKEEKKKLKKQRREEKKNKNK